MEKKLEKCFPFLEKETREMFLQQLTTKEVRLHLKLATEFGSTIHMY